MPKHILTRIINTPFPYIPSVRNCWDFFVVNVLTSTVKKKSLELHRKTSPHTPFP